MKAAAAMLLALALASCATPASGSFVTLYVKDRPFRVEIAATPQQHAQGLMHRRSLPPDGGMLFVFPDEQPRSFWMKNTLIPLDMLFINAERVVVDLVHSAPPCRAEPCPSYDSAWPARYVLELAGGTATRLQLKVGDSVFIPALENARPD